MKIAALIQAHHKPRNLEILLERLSGPLWHPYVHIDRKAAFDDFGARARHAALPQRMSVFWGGFSQVQATLALLRASYANSDLTHFYLMSGQCFPLKTDDEVRQALSDVPNNGAGFMTIVGMPSAMKPITRLTRRHDNDFPPGFRKRLLGALFRRLPDLDLQHVLHGLVPHAGSSWWLLDRDAVGSILSFLDANPWFVRNFRFSLCGDETFFQTLFVALGLHQVGRSPTAAKWSEGSANPEIIDPDLFEQAAADWHLFARKFDGFYPATVRDVRSPSRNDG